MLDLLLVNPLFLKDDPVERRVMTPYFPLGLLYLAASVREAGYRVAVFDGMFHDHESAFPDVLKYEQPRTVGISVLATVRRSALRLAEIAHDFGSAVLLGGADPTGRPEPYLQHERGGCHPVDAVVVGEGEQTLVELLAVMKPGETEPSRLRSVRGIAYRDSEGKVQSTAMRPLREDLDDLPLPAWDLVDIESYRSAWLQHHEHFSLPLITARGCPYSCSWCQKNVFGRSFRQHSPGRVADEMIQLKQRYAPDQLRIVDDVLGINRSWMRAWRTAVREREAGMPFECLCRVDLLDEETAGILKDVGCRRISFGAESGSQRILDAMGKEIRVEQIQRAAEVCRDNGIETYFYIMLGYPGEEWRDIRATIALLRKTVPDAFSMTVAYPLPGTPFYEEVKDRLLVAPDWDYSAENRLVFERRYSTAFYRWVQRLLFKEWILARRRRKGERMRPAGWLRQILSLWVLRALTWIHRFRPVGRGARRETSLSESGTG